jgi:hypothetical protein
MKKIGVSIAAVLLAGAVAFAQVGTQQSSNNAQNNSQNTQSVASTPERVRTSQPEVLPAGTQLIIRTNENIMATPSDVGRTYSAEVARAIEDQSGSVLVPKNSPVELTVAKVNNPTLGQEEVSLAIRSINIQGHTYQLATGNVTQKGSDGLGANKKTAEYVGGGAVLGTVIGAIAGGGKGAAIGAAVGGAGGAATQVLTKGKEVKVPAESVLTFQLENPVRLQP